MREHPRLLRGDMVRATLDGRKTQTRSPVTVPWTGGKRCAPYEPYYIDTDGVLMVMDEYGDYHRAEDAMKSPFGAPGDRLWVRETWAHYQPILSLRKTDGRSITDVSDGAAAYKADCFDSIEDCREHLKLTHGASCEAIEIRGDRWRPSIHMPRWASRINLLVKRVWIERVQDISEEDARAEGIATEGNGWMDYRKGNEKQLFLSDPRDSFRTVWDSIYAERGYEWDKNPWIWACEFELESSPKG